MAGLQCTQAERDALASAIKRGVQSVGFGENQVKYASIAEMRSILSDMDLYLAGTSAPARFSRAAFSRG